jgi:isoleucyl-tRNA synthetase
MSLPMNNAIAVHPNIEYAAIESPEETRLLKINFIILSFDVF